MRVSAGSRLLCSAVKLHCLQTHPQITVLYASLSRKSRPELVCTKRSVSCSIPGEFLRGTKEKDDQQEDPQDDHGDAPDGAVPLIMFINCSSGGLVGPALANRFADVVGASQVIPFTPNRESIVADRLEVKLPLCLPNNRAKAVSSERSLCSIRCSGESVIFLP